MSWDVVNKAIKRILKFTVPPLGWYLTIWTLVLSTLVLTLKFMNPEELNCHDYVSISTVLLLQTTLLRFNFKRCRFAWALSAAITIVIFALTVNFLSAPIELTTNSMTLTTGSCDTDNPRCCQDSSETSDMLELQCNPITRVWTVKLADGQDGERLTIADSLETEDMWTTPLAEGSLENDRRGIFDKLPPCSIRQSRGSYILQYHPYFLAVISFFLALEALTILHILLWNVQNFNRINLNIPSRYQRFLDRFIICVIIISACLVFLGLYFLELRSSDKHNGVTRTTHSIQTTADLRDMARSLEDLHCCSDADSDENCQTIPALTAASQSGQPLSLCCPHWFLNIQFTSSGILNQTAICDRNVDTMVFLGGPEWYQHLGPVLAMWILEIACIVSGILWLSHPFGRTGTLA